MTIRRASFIAGALALLGLAGLATAADYPRGKLPATVTPLGYRLELDVDPAQPRFSGRADITVRVSGRTRLIWLHGLGLEVTRARVRAGNHWVSARYSEVDPVSGVARLALAEPIAAGEAHVEIVYSAAYTGGADGFYRVQAADAWYVFSDMEPIDARRAFPGFDEPRFKTPFVLAVTVPRGNRVVSNAPLESVVPVGKDRELHRFRPTLPLPTYLLALAVGPLDVIEAPPIPANEVRGEALPLRGVATRGQGARLAYVLSQTPELVTRLERYFGSAFPFPKLDMIASPQQAGAMENAGAIMFGDDVILLAPDAPAQQRANFGDTVAHELAHHWFGDLVTPLWWDDIWLNESFAEWMGIKIADEWHPDLDLPAALTSDALDAMDIDSRVASRPVRERIDDNRRIASTFDKLTYQKGGGVLSMFESYLGEDVFRRGVREHLARHRYAGADSSQFFAALAESSAQPEVVAAFRSFVDQAGVPVVTVRRAGDGSRLELTQERYLPIGSPLGPGGTWKIPFCATLYSGAASRKACTLLSAATGALELPADFKVDAVMPNAAGAGYYRFALPAADLGALIARAASLPEREALALGDSVASGFASKRVSFDQVLRAAAALADHPRRDAALNLGLALVSIGDRMLTRTQREALRRELGRIYGPKLSALGLDVAAGAYAHDPAERQLLRRGLLSIVALGARDPDVRRALRDATLATLERPEALDPSLRDRAWIVAAQEAGPRMLPVLEKFVLESADPLIRAHAARALAATEDAAISASVRDFALGERVHANEMLRITFGQFGSPETRPAALAWLAANREKLFHRLPGFEQPVLFEGAGQFCDVGDHAAIEASLSPVAKALGTGELELARALEDVDLCVAQKAAHAAAFRSLLGD